MSKFFLKKNVAKKHFSRYSFFKKISPTRAAEKLLPKMPKNLVIVESPAKAKTLEKFLGSDFSVLSSFGHIRDLPKKQMNIDIEGGTFAPKYEITPDKKKTVAALKKAAKNTEIWLASDEDREGEAIAWHICAALGVEPQKTKRIVFHEITKSAILSAVKSPRTIDQNLVDAQQARRVLDRLVGYEVSPVLWKKVKFGLSAGRVQSVAVRIIVEREREIEAFSPQSAFKVSAEFDLGGGKILKAERAEKFQNEKDAQNFLESCVGADFSISDLVKKPGKKSPAPPFTTSTLQQEASRKLGFSVKRTMVVAQKLYESGKITYMRTDSLNLSEQALGSASAEIEKSFGKKYAETRRFKTKSAGAQEAHEAIRPTSFALKSAGADADQKKLYSLIWQRAIASQMAEAQLEKTTANISISTLPNESLVATGEVVKFDGFLKVYFESSDEDAADPLAKNALPPIKKGQNLNLDKMTARENFSRPPARFTEASLVKKLEEMGIGRPSTYAPTISTIIDRSYVEKTDREGVEREYRVLTLAGGKISSEKKTEITGAERAKLFPTDTGTVVSDFLVAHFSEIVDFDFTKKVEAEFDQIAAGKKVWNEMIRGFYGGFHKTVEKSDEISREEAVGERRLGVDPKSGKPVLVRLGRFGPMIQIGTRDDEEKPRFASLPAGEKMETISLESALAQFEFPRMLGQTKSGDEVSVHLGRFGPYLKCGELNVSLPRARKDRETGETIPAEDPNQVDLARAEVLVAQKKEADAKKFIAVWEDVGVQLLRGPYGIYLKSEKKGNVRIPKDFPNPEKMKKNQALEIIEKAPEKKAGAARRFARKK